MVFDGDSDLAEFLNIQYLTSISSPTFKDLRYAGIASKKKLKKKEQAFKHVFSILEGVAQKRKLDHSSNEIGSSFKSFEPPNLE
jgi:hypothetical protein